MQNAETVTGILRARGSQPRTARDNRWRAGCAERVRRLTRRWIAPAGGRGSGGGDLWAARPT